MYIHTIATALLSTIPITLSAPASVRAGLYEPPFDCGYVLTERNSSTYASVSTFPDCTAIYYNYSIPGFQDAYAYSLYDGCQCTFHSSEEQCKEGYGAIYEGPTPGKPGKEPLFEEPKPKWYYCEQMASTSR